MKKLTIGEFLKSPRCNLHVKIPTKIDDLLQAEANRLYGRNKSLLVISILAERYNVLAPGSE